MDPAPMTLKMIINLRRSIYPTPWILLLDTRPGCICRAHLQPDTDMQSNRPELKSAIAGLAARRPHAIAGMVSALGLVVGFAAAFGATFLAGSLAPVSTSFVS
jgi:hypothetical protein